MIVTLRTTIFQQHIVYCCLYTIKLVDVLPERNKTQICCSVDLTIRDWLLDDSVSNNLLYRFVLDNIPE